MARCLLDKLLSVCNDEGLICAAISRGYALDELCEDYLEMFKLATRLKSQDISLTVFPEPVASDNPSRLWPFSRCSKTD